MSHFLADLKGILDSEQILSEKAEQKCSKMFEENFCSDRPLPPKLLQHCLKFFVCEVIFIIWILFYFIAESWIPYQT